VVKASSIIQYLEKKYPLNLGYDWDNNGIQIGDETKQVKKVMIALEITKSVVDEAIMKKVDMIISHHPLIFKPVSSIHYNTIQGKKIIDLIKNDILVYSMHTNYDIADGGLNDNFATILNLQDVEKFSMIDNENGLGRVGQLKAPLSVEKLAQNVTNGPLSSVVSEVKIVGDIKKIVSKVAVIGGNGSKYIHDAHHALADVLITGDVGYHTAVDALELGLALIDIGHFAEKIMEKQIAEELRARFDLDIVVSENLVNPYSV